VEIKSINGSRTIEETIADELVHVVRNDIVNIRFHIRQLKKRSDNIHIKEIDRLINEVCKKMEDVETRIRNK